MARFLVTYHGGSGMPETEEGRQQVMAAFGAWAAATGDALIDPGAPLGRSKTIASEVTDGPAEGAASGYSVLEAADLDSAVELVRTHPFVARGGSLQVSEAVSP